MQDILVTLQYYKLKKKGSYSILAKRLYDFGIILTNYKINIYQKYH